MNIFCKGDWIGSLRAQQSCVFDQVRSAFDMVALIIDRANLKEYGSQLFFDTLVYDHR